MSARQNKTSWYVFFSIAFLLVVVLSLAASIRLTALGQEIRSQAAGETE
jgi:uncharacterized membrane protein